MPARRLRPTAVVLCLAAGLLVMSRARAGPRFQPSTTVVLFTPAPADPLVARLEAELAGVGIQVRRVNLPAEDQLEAAVARELARGASAAIRVIPRARGADIWTGDATTGRLRRQTTGAGTSDLSVIALQTVEFLRATLLGATDSGAPTSSPPETPAPPAPPAERDADRRPERARTPGGQAPRGADDRQQPAEPSDPTTPAAEKTAAPQVKRERLPEWGLEAPAEASPPRAPIEMDIFAGPALMASPGGVPLVTAAAALGRIQVSPWVGIELTSVFPLVPGHLNNPEGDVAIRTALFGAALAFRLPARGRLSADAAFGVAALWLRTAGAGMGDVGTAPNVGLNDATWKAAATARLGGGVNLNRWLSLRADVLGGLTGRTAVGYDVTDVSGQTAMTDRASWGPVFAVGTAGLQARW